MKLFLPDYDKTTNPKVLIGGFGFGPAAMYPLIVLNHHYKRMVPVLPVELSLKLERLLLSCRYEYSYTTVHLA